jgi:hypothetical protein
VHDGLPAARGEPALDPRARDPLPRGDPDVHRYGQLELVVTHVGGSAHLPVFELRVAP